MAKTQMPIRKQMNKEYTDISVVQDKSGSMGPLRGETIKGFNTFVEDQRKAPGKCTISLMQFDTTFNMVCNGADIQEVELLTEKTYQPSGYTALLDAIAKTIQTTGNRIEALPEDQRPARVIVAVFTDGEENSSQEFGGDEGRKKVFDMIKHQTEKYNWQFLFLGASQDAIKAGSGMGITANNAISTANNAQGTTHAYASLSSNVKSYRCADPADVDKLAFAPSQRKAQYSAGATRDAMADPANPTP